MKRLFQVRNMLLLGVVAVVQACNTQQEIPAPKLETKKSSDTESSICTDWYSGTTGAYITTTGDCSNYWGGGTSNSGFGGPSINYFPQNGSIPGYGGSTGGIGVASDGTQNVNITPAVIGDWAGILTFQFDRVTQIQVSVELDRENMRLEKATAVAVGAVPLQTFVQVGDAVRTGITVKTETYRFSVRYQWQTGTPGTGGIVNGPIRTLNGTISPITGRGTLVLVPLP